MIALYTKASTVAAVILYGAIAIVAGAVLLGVWFVSTFLNAISYDW